MVENQQGAATSSDVSACAVCDAPTPSVYCETCKCGICSNCKPKLPADAPVPNPPALIQQSKHVLETVSIRSDDGAQQQHHEALGLFQQALDTRIKILGKSHVKVADTHVEFAATLLVPNRHYTLGMEHYQKAIQIYGKLGGCASDKLQTIQQAQQQLEQTMVEAAQSYMMQGLDCQTRQQDNDKALGMFQMAYSLLECVLQFSPASKKGEVYQTYQLALADVCRVLASVHISSSHYTTAVPFLEIATKLLTESVGEDDERTLAMANDFATVQKLLEKHATKHNQRIPHWYERDNFVADSEAAADDSSSGATTAATNAATHNHVGISVHYIKTGFWKDLQAARLDATASMQDAVEKVIEMKDISYLASVDKKHTGPANLMVCYAPESSIADIINSLDEYCRTNLTEEGKPSDHSTYIWMKSLCLAPNEAPTTTKLKKDILANVSQVLAILTPWYHPLIWKNPQCLQDIYLASQTPNCKLTLALPPAQTWAVSDAIIGDPTAPLATLYEALEHLVVEDKDTTAVVTLDADTSPVSAAQQMRLSLQDIFRPWIRDIVKAQVQQQQLSTSGPSTPTMKPASPTNSKEALKLFQMQLSNKLGLLFWNYGEHKTALEMLEDALTMTEAMYGKHESTATVYRNIGNVLSDMGQYNLALQAHHKALMILEAAFHDSHPRVAETCSTIGNLYRLSNQLSKAMEYHQKALNLQKECYGSTQNLPAAESYRQLAQVFFSKGDTSAALAEFQKALQIQEAVLGEEGKNHPTLAATHCHLGMVYKKKQNFDAAFKEYQQAAAIYEATFGRNHIETATTFDHAASVLKLQDKLDEALDWYEQSKTMYEGILGMQHPTTAQAYHTVGQIQNDMDNVEEALSHYKKALEIRRAALGANHLTTAASLQTIGTLHFEIGEFDEALEELREAFDIVEPILGIEHPTTKQLADIINAVMEA
mgnify:CR=1 FL=1